MPLNWMDVSVLPFNTMLLLEKVQLSWFPGWLPEWELAVALHAHPTVAWYIGHKCPEIAPWLNEVLAQTPPAGDAETIREAEVAVLKSIEDLLVYVVDPAIYDAQPFLGWDSRELTELVNFQGKMVIDVGAGTGRLTFVAAERAYAVFSVEPVTNLRDYVKKKARAQGLLNVYAIDGTITDIPFPNAFADVTMGGHVFGDDATGEYWELARVTKPGGMIILCPGNNDKDDAVHDFLLAHGFQWKRFEEPSDGMKRKYWKER